MHTLGKGPEKGIWVLLCRYTSNFRVRSGQTAILTVLILGFGGSFVVGSQEVGKPGSREASGLFKPSSPDNTNDVNRTGAVQAVIEFEETPAGRVVLGSLASRTQCRALTKSGDAPPYLMTGNGYSYETDKDYSEVCLECGPQGNLREGVEIGNSANINPASQFTRTFENIAGRGTVVRLFSMIEIAHSNLCSGNQAFGTVFGPEIYTAAFQATAGQSLSYNWSASDDGDDYEAYGFLVKLNDTDSDGSYTDEYTGTATLLSYGRGK